MIKEWLLALAEQIVPIINLIALVIITAGTIEAFISGLGLILSRPRDHHALRSIWMNYSRWLIAGLTFQLAADIIETSATPNWDDIGRLAAIAVIRTFLDYVLVRDQSEVRELQQAPKTG